MKIDMPAGSYVVAVSGGVDSMVLLDLLRLHPGVRLTVAHFDHGIREDSAEDRLLVQRQAKRYKMPFVYDMGRLGADTSEAQARGARYAFLRTVQETSQANALLTAHHQDDVLETVIINLLRGTGRKGLSSLTNGEGIIRPLLNVPKSEILDYARRHGLIWREDSTNASDNYLRNRVRHNILPEWNAEQKKKLLAINLHMREVNKEVDQILEPEVQGDLDREWFVSLPHDVAREVIAAWLRLNSIGDFDRSTLERLTIAGKVADAGKSIDIVNGYKMQVSPGFLALTGSER